MLIALAAAFWRPHNGPHLTSTSHAETSFTKPEALAALACEQARVHEKLLFALRTYLMLHLRSALDARMEKMLRELGVDDVHLRERRWHRPW